MVRRHVALIGLSAVPLLVLGVFFVLPVAGMIAQGFMVDGRLDVRGVLEVLARPRVHRVLWFTLWSSTVGTATSLLLGLPAAYALHRLDFPLRRRPAGAAAGAVRAADRRGRRGLPAAAR